MLRSSAAAALLLTASGWAQETRPVGKSKVEQERNAALLAGYDYGKYEAALTGFTGQDLQRIATVRWHPAVRTRIGERGNYKVGLARRKDGALVAVVCRDNYASPQHRYWNMFVYESRDQGVNWTEIGKTPLMGKEPTLTALPDGVLLLTAEKADYRPGARRDEIPVYRSEDGGRTWSAIMLAGPDIPRNHLVEPDGTVLMVRALKPDWSFKGQGSPNFQLARSRDGGRTWTFSEAKVDWDEQAFGEISTTRLKDGHLLATIRRAIPGTRDGHGYADTLLTESHDGGENWSRPRQMSNTAEVHFQLLPLQDGRLLATYTSYHLPWGVFAVLSPDGGKTWSFDRPIQLALSALYNTGWPYTLQLADGSLITAYATTTYLKQLPEASTSEVVRWRLPE